MIIKFIQELLREDKSVKVNSLIYEELQKAAFSEGVELNFFINNLIREALDRKEKDILGNEEWTKKQEELIPYYNFLDTYLFATLNGKVEIGITNQLIGYETNTDIYELLDYKLTNKYRCLTLFLKQHNKEYPISFEDIQDIKFLDNGRSLKVWIYMPRKTWRFYLVFDKEKLNDKFNSKSEIVNASEVE